MWHSIPSIDFIHKFLVKGALTTVTTLRHQKRDVLDYLTAACAAAIRTDQPPSLLPESSTI
jgi:hypothetical protein